MNNLIETIISEKRPYITSSELAKYLGLETEDVDKVIIKASEIFVIKSDNKGDFILDKDIILFISTKLPWIDGTRDATRVKIMDLIRKLKYIELTKPLKKYNKEGYEMNNILEKLKEEKRTYITDFELAAFLDLDLGDVVSIIESVSLTVDRLFKDKPSKPSFIKADGKYILDRDSIIFLLPDFGHNVGSIRYRMIELIKLLYINKLEKIIKEEM